MLAWFFLVSAALHGCLHSQEQTRLPALPTVSGGEGPSPAWRLGRLRRLSTRAQGCFRVPRRVHGQWACYQGRRGCRKTRTGGAGAKSPGAGAAFRPAAGAAHSQQACGGALVLRSARAPQPPAQPPRLPLSSPGGCRAVPAEGRGPGTSCCTARLAWLPRNGCYTRAARRGSASPSRPLGGRGLLRRIPSPRRCVSEHFLFNSPDPPGGQC